jgi:hypothetical protein
MEGEQMSPGTGCASGQGLDGRKESEHDSSTVHLWISCTSQPTSLFDGRDSQYTAIDSLFSSSRSMCDMLTACLAVVADDCMQLDRHSRKYYTVPVTTHN